MENLNNIQKSRLLSIYNDTTIGKSQVNDLEKSQSSNLVEKKVQIHKKDGTTFYAIRWVDPTTEQSHDIQHPKYQHTDINGATQEDKIHSVVHHTTMTANDKVRKLVGLGIHDKKQLSELSGHKYPSDIHTLVKKETGVDLKSHTPTTSLPTHKDPSNPVNFTSHEGQVLAISKIAELHGSKEAFKRQKEMASQVQKDLNLTVDDKWDSYSTDLNMLLDGELGLRAVMGYGTGGAGKTHQLESIIIPEKKLIEFDPEMDMEAGGDEYDYVKIGGKIGSREVQRKMYEHQNKVLIFDDCDSMWNDDGLINVLKNALDTSGRGKVQWAMRLPETAKDKGDEVPSSFVFSGRMIFITNLTKQELVDRGAAAVVESRCASTDLSMNLEQTLERLDKISPYLKLKDENRNDITDLQEEDKSSALKAFKEMSHLGRIDQVNTRVLTQIVAKARYARRTLGLTGEAKHDFLKKQLAKQFGF